MRIFFLDEKMIRIYFSKVITILKNSKRTNNADSYFVELKI